MNPTIITSYSPSDLLILALVIIAVTAVALISLALRIMAPTMKRQHQADREMLLEQLIADRDQLDEQINALSMSILKNMEDNDAKEKAETPAIKWDPTSRFPDPAPRSY
jgi:Tfp pilus assembly protein PilV